MSTTTEAFGARVPAARPRRAPVRRPRAFGVFFASVSTFLVILAVLSWRMAAGEDPALGAGDPSGSNATASTDPGVVHRRIVALKVVHDPAPVPAETDDGIVAAPAPAVSTPAAPVTAPAAPAPVQAAPAPAPAPAPAAPVTSSS